MKFQAGKFMILYGIGTIVLTHVVKSQAQRTLAVDGSNERLDHADEELDTVQVRKLVGGFVSWWTWSLFFSKASSLRGWSC